MQSTFVSIVYKIVKEKDLSVYGRLVFLVLFEELIINKQPSIKEMAIATGLTTNTVIKELKILEEKGFICVDRTKKYNRYEFVQEKLI